ncbi:MAG: hypothetical protein ACLTDR_12410 [Adlercreutzia equolifaciens]
MYPCGEGAGYASGPTASTESAAVDGLRSVAEAIASTTHAALSLRAGRGHPCSGCPAMPSSSPDRQPNQRACRRLRERGSGPPAHSTT